MNLAACSRLVLGPENRTWFRAFDPKHIATPLATNHSMRDRSRFSPGESSTQSFEILYLSENHSLCLWETGALLGSNNAPTSIPTSSSIISVEVSLQGVADLTKMAEQRRLKTNVQELTGDWRYYHTRTLSCPVPEPRGTNAPTQDLGEALFGTPYIEGFRAVSAKVPNQKNLIVFPQKLRKGSYLRYRDSDGNVVDEING